MNEQIKELVSESNLDIYGLGKDRYRWEYTIQKFAELIIKEIENMYISGESDASDVFNFLLDVKKHFGVK